MTEKRKPLSRREFGLLLIQQEGKCANCGVKLDFTKPRQVIDEHLQPLFSNGSNGLDNRALWCVNCSKAKTSGEAPARAKVRRFEQQKTQAAKRTRNPSRLSKNHPNYQSRKMPSRAFEEGISK